MGGWFSKRLEKMMGNCHWQRCLMVGLDAAGKTTILYKLKHGQVVTTIPTIGFNVETIETPNFCMQVWDIGGQDKIRPLWRHYYSHCAAIIFAIDSNDRERIDDAKDELHKMLAEDELRDALLLVYANKQDLPKVMSVNEITERLGLKKLKNRRWYIQSSSATSGDGLYEGLDWISQTMREKRIHRNIHIKTSTLNAINPIQSIPTATRLNVTHWSIDLAANLRKW